MTKQESLGEIIKRIVSISAPEKIILFGSHAYGIPSHESDFDFVVIKSNIKSKIEEYTKIRRGLKGIHVPLDIILFTPEEYEYYSSTWRNSIASTAREKGKILYYKQKRAA